MVGEYEVRGKKKYLYGKSKKDVATRLSKAIADRDSGLVYDGGSLTVGEYLDRWLAAIENTLRPRSFKRYEESARLHIKPTLGRVRLTRLDALQLQNLYGSKLASELSPRTVQIVHATMHKALKQAVKWRLIPYNVAEAAEKPRAPRAEIQPLDTEQVTRLLVAAAETELYALYMLAISTGMRQGELLGLQWADVNLDRGVLQVRRSSSNGHIHAPKTNKSRRSIKLPNAAVEALRRHPRGSTELSKDQWIFGTSAGTPIITQNFYNKESLEMAKQILSEGCLKRQIAEGTNKGVHGKLVEVDGPTALWTTTTKVRTDYELSNRVFELTPDDSRPQTRSIIKNVFQDDRTKVDFGPARALFTWLAGQDNRVVIPYGPALGELLPDSSVRMRREAIRVRNLICAHATLHQASRGRDEQGRIVATLDDYEAMRALVEDIVGATAEKSVRPEVRETVEAAQALIESEEHGHSGVTISEMEVKLNRDYSTTSRRMKNASPYLIEFEEKRGRSKQFGLGIDLPAETNALPTVDEVCKFACVCGSGGVDANHDENCPLSSCKTRANLRANFDQYVSEEDRRAFTNRENWEDHEEETDESGPSEDHVETCKLHDRSCPNPELCVQDCANFAGSSVSADESTVPIAYRLLEMDEAVCDGCGVYREQDVAVRPLRLSADQRIWFASEICRICEQEHPGFYDDGYVDSLTRNCGWSVTALEPMPTAP